MQTVEAHAHAAHVKAALRVKDRPRRVVAVDEPGVEPRATKGLDRLAEAVELQGEVPVVEHVGGGEVREGARALQPAMEVDRAPQLHHVGSAHTDARHARVDGKVVSRHAMPASRSATPSRTVATANWLAPAACMVRAHGTAP